MINPKKEDIGRQVIFRIGKMIDLNNYGYGKITGFNDLHVYVKFGHNNNSESILRKHLHYTPDENQICETCIYGNAKHKLICRNQFLVEDKLTCLDWKEFDEVKIITDKIIYPFNDKLEKFNSTNMKDILKIGSIIITIYMIFSVLLSISMYNNTIELEIYKIIRIIFIVSFISIIFILLLITFKRKFDLINLESEFQINYNDLFRHHYDLFNPKQWKKIGNEYNNLIENLEL